MVDWKEQQRVYLAFKDLGGPATGEEGVKWRLKERNKIKEESRGCLEDLWWLEETEHSKQGRL